MLRNLGVVGDGRFIAVRVASPSSTPAPTLAPLAGVAQGPAHVCRSAKAKVLQLPDSPEEVECEVTEEALAVKQYGTSAEQLDRHAC